MLLFRCGNESEATTWGQHALIHSQTWNKLRTYLWIMCGRLVVVGATALRILYSVRCHRRHPMEQQ